MSGGTCREHSLSNSVRGRCIWKERNNCFVNVDRWSVVDRWIAHSCSYSWGSQSRSDKWVRLCPLKAYRRNDPNPIPWGKPGLSNKGVKGEGAKDRTEHSTFLYHSLRAESVSGEEEVKCDKAPLYPQWSARRWTGAKSCSIMTEAFMEGWGNHSRMCSIRAAL